MLVCFYGWVFRLYRVAFVEHLYELSPVIVPLHQGRYFRDPLNQGRIANIPGKELVHLALPLVSFLFFLELLPNTGGQAVVDDVVGIMPEERGTTARSSGRQRFSAIRVSALQPFW